MQPHKGNQKILIIESDSTFADQVEQTLIKHSYSVIVAKNGPDGLKAIFDTLPHLILLDAAIEGLESYEILEKKQAEAMLAKIPVFLISTQVAPINMRRVPEGSVKEFLMALHVDPSDIVDKIDKYFGNEARKNVSAIETDGTKIKLLWVEDDKLIGTILSKKMIASGLDLFHAKNGEEATEALKTIIPDVIILDLVLPGKSGFEILADIKKDPRISKVPVMILSNLSKQSDIERGKLLGAQKFLVKAAVSLDQIIEEVRTLYHK